MNKVNILWADELDTYELAKNCVEHFWEDRQKLEHFEQELTTLIWKFTPKDKDLHEEILTTKCYTWAKINQLLFDIC